MFPVGDIGLKASDFVTTDGHVMVDELVPQVQAKQSNLDESHPGRGKAPCKLGFLKIFAMFPVGDIGLKASDFVTTDGHVMVDELVPQRFPEHSRR
jgi:hypothetical protein